MFLKCNCRTQNPHYINKKETLKVSFLNGGAKDAKLELLCKIFIDKLTSESILYIDFALSEYQKIKNVA